MLSYLVLRVLSVSGRSFYSKGEGKARREDSDVFNMKNCKVFGEIDVFAQTWAVHKEHNVSKHHIVPYKYVQRLHITEN